jgi:Raf kinase inhibitor-like YbhB/YbcL family protein
MSKFSIISDDFKEGEEIPKKFGYKFENKEPKLDFYNIPEDAQTLALIMDDPDAMDAVGKVWVHWLVFGSISKFPNGNLIIQGKNDFEEIGYGGPAPPDKRHTYIFKVYALDTELLLKEGFSKKDLEDAMKGHIIAEGKLTGTFAP